MAYPFSLRGLLKSRDFKGSFTYYVITKGEGGGFWNDYANVIFALSSAESDYGRGEGA